MLRLYEKPLLLRLSKNALDLRGFLIQRIYFLNSNV
jgi:hypothetical protein